VEISTVGNVARSGEEDGVWVIEFEVVIGGSFAESEIVNNCVIEVGGGCSGNDLPVEARQQD
jgi:hypothetical protein